MQLLQGKKIDDISVSELTRQAQVGRVSFYRNYQSIEEIIRQFLEERTSRWWDGLIACPDRYPHAISEMFQHFLDMREEIELLYRTGLSHLLMEHIVRCGKQSRTGEWKNTYQTAFLSGALCGLVNEWVLQGMKDSPEKMEQIFLKQETENDDP